MSSLDEAVRDQIIAKAIEAKNQSYSPYSKFRVGCCLVTGSGKLFHGCNVENASYGLAICAERTAYVKAVSEGERKFVAVAVSTDVADYISPCGACRQFMAEFGLDTEIILIKAADDFTVKRVTDLLPNAFTPASLPQ